MKGLLKEQDLPGIIKEILEGRTAEPIRNEESHCIQAAVLIPLFNENGEYKILFTKRTDTVENHKGQISFPGGTVEKGDSTLLETALREAHEEIGLLQRDVEILGQIDDATTVVSNFIVHPFVGLIPYPYHFRINSVEVERLIQVPFNIFLSDDPKYKRNSAQFEGITYSTPAYLYHGDLIWGATARILENFMGILKGKLDLPLKTE
jgi:8-oxo-dGTP pyrophosphatase MutT (NUDIX family)